jgi:hypothetical protein
MKQWVKLEPRHLGAVDALHDEQERMLNVGRKKKRIQVDRPDLLRKPIAMACGLEKDGQLVGGFYIELVGELCFFGTSAEATAEAEAIAPEVFETLTRMGVRFVRCNVPRRPKGLLARLRAALTNPQVGFVDDGKYLNLFTRDLRGKE